jgi:hypothetical protein
MRMKKEKPSPAFRFDEKIVILFADGKEFMLDLSSIVGKFVGYVNLPFRIYVGKRLCCETNDWKAEPDMDDVPKRDTIIGSVGHGGSQNLGDIARKQIDNERIVREDHRSDP